MIDFSALQNREKELLLTWFMYYIPQGDSRGTPETTGATRGELRKQYPDIYDRMYKQGKEVAG